MLYFWKAGGSRMSHMTFPCVNPIQLGPSPFNSTAQCQKSSLRHHFRQNSYYIHYYYSFMAAYEPKMAKKCTVENCGTTYLLLKSKNNCSLFSSTFHVERPVSRYGRLKLKFLCERLRRMASLSMSTISISTMSMSTMSMSTMSMSTMSMLSTLHPDCCLPGITFEPLNFNINCAHTKWILQRAVDG